MAQAFESPVDEVGDLGLEDQTERDCDGDENGHLDQFHSPPASERSKKTVFHLLSLSFPYAKAAQPLQE